MFSRRSIAIAVAMLSCSPLVAHAQPMVRTEEPALLSPVVKKRRAARRTTYINSRRSKNPPPKRQLKANRLHISRRTKRRHRRAA